MIGAILVAHAAAESMGCFVLLAKTDQRQPPSPCASARMITSKLTSKAQTTIPQAVRNALGVKPGDEIAYAIADGHVLLTKAAKHRRGAPFEDPFAFFGEWDTPEDDEAFGDL
jgi:antitoxin PrlF